MREIIGHAIVSLEGHIASADGTIPQTLHNAADWARFQAELDRADLVVLGRKGHERFPNPGRRRLVATRSVAALDPDPRDDRATLWNPQGLGFEDALARLGLSSGRIAVAGVFDLFAELFTRFDLAESNRLLVPGGLPCFAAGHPRAVLSRHGLEPETLETLDRAATVTLTRWRRATLPVL